MEEKVKSVHITEEEHRRLKVRAAELGIPLNELIDQIISEWVEPQRKGDKRDKRAQPR